MALSHANEQLEKTADGRTMELSIFSKNVAAHFAFVDPNLRYQFANRMYREMFRRKPEELIGYRVSIMMDPDTYANS